MTFVVHMRTPNTHYQKGISVSEWIFTSSWKWVASVNITIAGPGYWYTLELTLILPGCWQISRACLALLGILTLTYPFCLLVMLLILGVISQVCNDFCVVLATCTLSRFWWILDWILIELVNSESFLSTTCTNTHQVDHVIQPHKNE